MNHSINDKIRIRAGLPPRPSADQATPKPVAADPAVKAREVAMWLREKKAAEVAAFDLSGLSAVTESMVIATARSARHAQGLADYLLQKAGEDKLEMLGMEGYEAGQWILVDLNDVLVHIFQEDNRKKFNLEGLWSDAAVIALPPEEEEEAASVA